MAALSKLVDRHSRVRVAHRERRSAVSDLDIITDVGIQKPGIEVLEAFEELALC